MNPELLINKYIPNLTAEPFQISKAYAERIYQQTNSPRLKKTLKNWSSWLTNSHNLSSGFKHKTSCFPTTSTISNDLLSSVPLQPLPNIKEIHYEYEDKVEAKAAPPPTNESAAASPAVVAAPVAVAVSSAQAEFGSIPDKAEEMPLGELGAALQLSYSGAIGKDMSALISRLPGSKMPGRGGSLDGLDHGTGQATGIRSGGQVVPRFRRAGVWRGAAGAAGGSAGGAIINLEEFKKFQQSQDAFVSQQLEVLLQYLKQDSRDGYRLHDYKHADYMRVQDELDSIQKEHGENYLKGIQPVFDPLKARHFDFAWNWVQQTALEMFFDIIYGRLKTVDRDITAKCLMLLSNCREAIGTAPLYRDVTFPTAPKITVTLEGEILYEEVNRVRVSRLERYVAEMAAGSKITAEMNLDKVQECIQNLYKLVKSQPTIAKSQMAAIRSLYGEVVKPTALSGDKTLLLHPKRKLYLDVLTEIASAKTTFEHKNALLTGAGKANIGVEILKGLLSGGAHVIVTTSRYSRATVKYYQAIYQEVGSRGSRLTVVPFNQGSKQVVEENGRKIDGLDDQSKLAHRVMLTNLLRLMGEVKKKKHALKLVTRPTQVVLPCSTNGPLNPGESTCVWLAPAGAVIGWTRGTGLMLANNLIAEGVEINGVHTFSAKEMAFNILGLMHPLLFDVAQVESVWADLNGGMDKLPDLAEISLKVRQELNELANVRSKISLDNAIDFKVRLCMVPKPKQSITLSRFLPVLTSRCPCQSLGNQPPPILHLWKRYRQQVHCPFPHERNPHPGLQNLLLCLGVKLDHCPVQDQKSHCLLVRTRGTPQLLRDTASRFLFAQSIPTQLDHLGTIYSARLVHLQRLAQSDIAFAPRRLIGN
ncbi:hypothetical protein PCANC_19643 [Puccinia coronata f. sp. avenae]|uniref:Fatty acid synthase type I helical domain-containing protein n=1 Tax=Puccinia coronata f. sp. avenae TaxID=200324 RepID=A0A2N5UI04_9BASI|nr:hypothetical protein PCANC_19643 [Puccinia coronata f. sp. avenae]